ncbi:MAG: hypothetical protein II938_03485 [Alphaproteobacteria bacterium]|nr:hypothetical protein [Alphaproteobacteria bacterium]
MKKLILLSFLVLLGCATEQKYHDKLDAWKGKSKADLVLEWGVPTDKYKADKTLELLEYKKSRTIYGGKFECKTTFIIKNNVVDQWKTEGNDCRSY